MPIVLPSGGGGGGGFAQIVPSQLLVGSAASIDFQNIPATANHLLLVTSLRGDTAAGTVNVLLRLNNDSGANYDWQRNTAAAAAATQSESLGATSIYISDATAATATANFFSGHTCFLPNYAGITGNKTVITSGFFASANTTGLQNEVVLGGKWRTTGTAVTRVTIFPSAGNFVAGSQATLYGLT